jgi:protein disulfide-isomerase A1
MKLKTLFFGALAALLSVGNSEVIPFDNKAIEKIFQNKNPALILFASDNEESTVAKEGLKALDEAGTDSVVLSVTEATDGHGLFDRLA